jgi:hypothetical protein
MGGAFFLTKDQQNVEQSGGRLNSVGFAARTRVVQPAPTDFQPTE